MKDSIKLELLKIVAHNGNIFSLTKHGYNTDQIIDMLKEIIREGLFVRNGNSLIITKKGKSEIDGLNSKLGNKNINKWIEPKNSSRIPTISINDVFLPNQKELFFD